MQNTSTEDSLISKKSHTEISGTNSNNPCLRLDISKKCKSECILHNKYSLVQQIKNRNHSEPINDVNFENVINYYKVLKTNDTSQFSSDQFIKKLDERIREKTDILSKFTESTSIKSYLNEIEIDNQSKARIEELEQLTKGVNSCLDNNLLRLGSVEFEYSDGPPTRIYRFPSTGIGLDRSEGSVFNMTVTRQHSNSSLIARHWGPQREVIVHRDANNSLGISIVGGKVR